MPQGSLGGTKLATDTVDVRGPRDTGVSLIVASGQMGHECRAQFGNRNPRLCGFMYGPLTAGWNSLGLDTEVMGTLQA